jgi:hypothetical protein
MDESWRIQRDRLEAELARVRGERDRLVEAIVCDSVTRSSLAAVIEHWMCAPNIRIGDDVAAALAEHDRRAGSGPAPAAPP